MSMSRAEAQGWTGLPLVSRSRLRLAPCNSLAAFSSLAFRSRTSWAVMTRVRACQPLYLNQVLQELGRGSRCFQLGLGLLPAHDACRNRWISSGPSLRTLPTSAGTG